MNAVTGVATETVDCPAPGVDLPEVIIEVPTTDPPSCWTYQNCTIIPPRFLPGDPLDPIIDVPVNTPSPPPPPPSPSPPAPTPPPAPPVSNTTVPGQEIEVEGGTCTFGGGAPGACVPVGTPCPDGSLPVAGDRNGKCPSTGQCCASATSLCRCNNSSNKADNCGYYNTQEQLRRSWG